MFFEKHKDSIKNILYFILGIFIIFSILILLLSVVGQKEVSKDKIASYEIKKIEKITKEGEDGSVQMISVGTMVVPVSDGGEDEQTYYAVTIKKDDGTTEKKTIKKYVLNVMKGGENTLNIYEHKWRNIVFKEDLDSVISYEINISEDLSKNLD